MMVAAVCRLPGMEQRVFPYSQGFSLYGRPDVHLRWLAQCLSPLMRPQAASWSALEELRLPNSGLNAASCTDPGGHRAFFELTVRRPDCRDHGAAVRIAIGWVDA
jgi:hypothetical protein